MSAVHQNDEAELRAMFSLRGTDPWPESLMELYSRARYLSERIGTGTMDRGTLIGLVLRVQDAEQAAGRERPAMPPNVERPVPQHQWKPKTPQADDAAPEVEKRGPGRPRKEQPVTA